MTTIDKSQPFVQHLGEITNGVRYSQDGKDYDNGGKLITSSVPKPNEESSLADMDRPTLLEYAMDRFGVKLKGNASTLSLRKQIQELIG